MINSILTLVVGLLLIFLEFYTPGAILGTLGGVLVLGSIVLLAVEGISIWIILPFVFIAIAGIIGVVKLALWRIRRSKSENGFYSNKDQSGYLASNYPKEMVGKKAKALTDLRPGGFIMVANQRLPAISLSGYITKGAEVDIVSGEGAHLLVKEIK